MRIKTLEYFIVLSESKSKNEAAQKLYISQPCLTKALQLLEDKLNTELFIRTKFGIELTQTGKEILPEIKEIVKLYNSLIEISNSVSSIKDINIYSHASLSGLVLP